MFLTYAYDQVGEAVDELVVLGEGDAVVFEDVFAPVQHVVFEYFIGDATFLILFALGDQQIVLILLHALVVALYQFGSFALFGEDFVFVHEFCV